MEYVLWAWKGDYINLGAGAEMGIYTGGSWLCHADHDIMLPMTMTLAYDNTTIIEYSDTTWWITGFNPNYTNVTADRLTVTFTVDFSAYPALFQGFSNSKSNNAGWTFDSQNYIAIFSY